MTRIDLHPEDLLDRAARGVASSADLARLEQHLAECPVCRVERALLVQAALDAAPREDEELVVARLTRDVSARLASPMARRARRKSAFVLAALVAVGVAGVAAAATLAIVRHAPKPAELATTAPSSPPAARAPQAPTADTHQLPVDATESAPSLQPTSAPPPLASSPVEPSSASDLFRRANQARRDGKVTEAARLYRALQERFAGTSEELVSRVSLGRLLLDRLGDSRGALVQFNSYLASPASGALREEAMVGRALALGRLGRAGEERAAWQALLDTWPKSTHRKRAQARLSELAAPAPTSGDTHRPRHGNGLGSRAE